MSLPQHLLAWSNLVPHNNVSFTLHHQSYLRLSNALYLNCAARQLGLFLRVDINIAWHDKNKLISQQQSTPINESQSVGGQTDTHVIAFCFRYWHVLYCRIVVTTASPHPSLETIITGGESRQWKDTWQNAAHVETWQSEVRRDGGEVRLHQSGYSWWGLCQDTSHGCEQLW